jgi:hypothetical protein
MTASDLRTQRPRLLPLSLPAPFPFSKVTRMPVVASKKISLTLLRVTRLRELNGSSTAKQHQVPVSGLSNVTAVP